MQALLHSFIDFVRKSLLIALSALVEALDEAAHIARYGLGFIVPTGFIGFESVLDVSLGLAVAVNETCDLVLKQADLVTLRARLLHFLVVVKVLQVFVKV